MRTLKPSTPAVVWKLAIKSFPARWFVFIFVNQAREQANYQLHPKCTVIGMAAARLNRQHARLKLCFFFSFQFRDICFSSRCAGVC